MMKLLRRLIRSTGYDLVRYRAPDPFANYADLSSAERDIIRRAQPYTMTSIERLAAVVSAVRHVVRHQIPGDIVECGVWRGGSAMAAVLALQHFGDTSRRVFLYDTFDGMSEPTEHDRSFDGQTAVKLLEAEHRGTGIWCCASFEDVQQNLFSTGYPPEKIHLVRGKVEETIPQNIPESIALLRLDTDWYESTRHELIHLYPRLGRWGVLIIDDYGHWEGARKATDEFLSTLSYPLFLHRIDYTGRAGIKPVA